MNKKLPKISFCGKELEPFESSHHFLIDGEVSSARVYLLSDRNHENKIFESKDVQLCIKKAFEQKEDAEVVVNVVCEAREERIRINCWVSKM